jgi:MFS family permease
VGSIGLSLIPILLVKRNVSTAEGALVLSTLKATILIGTLAGGALSDRFSSRGLTLAALLMSAVGLGFLPFQASILLILAFGILAQFAEALLNVVQRVLLMDQVDVVHQKESLGWMRMVANFAQIFSYSIAAAAAGLGVAPLMVLDASTSLFAFLLGHRILPRKSADGAKDRGLTAGKDGVFASKAAFLGCSLVLMGWSFFYELFLEGGAGRLEVLHPGEGLRRFSSMMILNTVLCAIAAVHATRFFHKAWIAITGGMLLTALGILVAGWGMESQAWVFFGMFLITLGELMLGAVAQYTLMRMTPGIAKAGLYYSIGLTVMQCGRIAGAALAFPLLIHATSLKPFSFVIVGVLAFQVVVLLALRRDVERLA